MNANVSKLLNEQINKEFYSAYLYLDFANYYAAVGLNGFENWYRVQAQEERDHAMLFYQYLQNNSESVTFEAIAKPEWERGDHMKMCIRDRSRPLSRIHCTLSWRAWATSTTPSSGVRRRSMSGSAVWRRRKATRCV